MAAKLGLLSLTELQKLTQSSQTQPTNSGSWMWNPKRSQDLGDDDSWEVKAFEEDTGNIMGTTWPPRSYSCTFCRREFRSAQALGGHMNVHRRDRARLHQTQPTSQLVPGAPNIINNHPNYINPSLSLTNLAPNFVAAQEFSAMNNGLCLVYQFPQHTSTNMSACPIDSSPSTFFSATPYNYQTASPENMVNASNYDNNCYNKWHEESAVEYNYKEKANCEELDLELRL